MECKNLAEQFYRIYKFNNFEYMQKYEYSSQEPFNLNICNVDKSQKSYQFLEYLYPVIVSDKSFVNITSESYLDLFPKRDIIYLSPHAEEVLTEYDNNAVFIIGGIVDRKEIITLSYPKAVQQNIRSMRLPIDSLINKCNIQSLDSVFKVLFDFKTFGVNNEKISLEERIRKNIPKHKLKPLTQTTVKRLQREQLTQISDDSNEFNEKFNNNIHMKCN